MRFTLTCLAGLFISLPLLARADEAPAGRMWAAHMDEPGLPNFARVNDHLYRGAQPTAEGFKRLEKLGIRTGSRVSFRLVGDRAELVVMDAAVDVQSSGAGLLRHKRAAVPADFDVASVLSPVKRDGQP